MAAYVNTNNAFSTLAGNIGPGDTSFTLAVGSSFPTVKAGDWTIVTFQDTANNIEIMKVTLHGDGTNSFQCVRAQENTGARSWIVGDFVECRFTAGITVTCDGVQTLTNKTIVSPTLRFADGSLANPGITWASEPTTGFARIGPNTMAVSINTQNVMQWQPSATIFNAPAYLTNGSSVNFRNAGNDAWWEALHGSSSNTLHVGRIGWTNTFIYGGGAGNINVHGGGVAFSGNITGINAGHVGLGNVGNQRQVYELRNGQYNIYIGWDGMLECQVNQTYFGRTWPINISGNAATCSGNAASANNANNANAVNGISGWNYSNRQKNPTYLWCSDGSTGDQYLTQPGYLRVDYANSAGYANNAGSTGSISGVGLGNLVRTNDGSVTNLRMWDDANEAVYCDFTANRNMGPGWNNFTITLWRHGPTMLDTATETVKAREVSEVTTETDLLIKAVQELTARLEALEAR